MSGQGFQSETQIMTFITTTANVLQFNCEPEKQEFLFSGVNLLNVLRIMQLLLLHRPVSYKDSQCKKYAFAFLTHLPYKCQ